MYGLNDKNRCFHCKELDSIFHPFLQWHYTQAFYAKVVDWFNAKFNCFFSNVPLKIAGTALNFQRHNGLKF